MPEPHVVGHEHEHDSGHRLVAHPPDALGEARPVGCESLPDDAHGLSVRQGDGGVQGHGPVPAEVDGECDVGDGGGDAVDGGQRVQALHQAAPPLGGERAGAHQLVRGHALLAGEPAQPCGGEVEPSRRGKDVRGVERRGAEPTRLQLCDGLVDRAPRPAGDGDHLQPVEEGHRRQGAEQLGLASCGPHSSASSPSSPALRSSSAYSASLPASAAPRRRSPLCLLRSGDVPQPAALPSLHVRGPRCPCR